MLFSYGSGKRLALDAVRHTRAMISAASLFVGLLYLAGCLAVANRVDPCAQATRFILDDQYMLLLWKEGTYPKWICDTFWIKHGGSDNTPDG